MNRKRFSRLLIGATRTLTRLPLRTALAAFGCCVAALAGTARAQQTDADSTNYHQWKLALESGGIADPVSLQVLPGFSVELVRVAQPGEGSWISLTFDPRERLIVGREDRGLLRFTLSADRQSVERVETINEDLLECRGLLFAGDSLYATANNSRGLYRLRDADGDDAWETVELLRELPGGLGHGRNGLALGPDGKLYLALGNNVQVPEQLSPGSPYGRWGLDRLLPCVWNEFLFDSDVRPPAGFVARCDLDGQSWELFAGGFRNPYGVAFNAQGELFTYDADMEWDEGAPWYRPTCVMHVVSGGEYGWRQGTSVWPECFADSLPRVVDVGLGSPTGVEFGTRSSFPAAYRDALFILDWAYGRIIAVHLHPAGASYLGTTQTIVRGQPLNVTDLEFGPDGALYFCVGGRGTQSALYRIVVDDPAALAEAAPPSRPEPDAADFAALRRRLTEMHDATQPLNRPVLLEGLAQDDRFIRQAARICLELRPPHEWQPDCLESDNTWVRLESLLVLVRQGNESDRAALLAELLQMEPKRLSAAQRLTLWRVVELLMIRLGPLERSQAQALETVAAACYPAASYDENYLLTEILVALESPDVVARALDLAEASNLQQEQLFYLFALRQAAAGWDLSLRSRYIALAHRAESFVGAQYLARFVTFIRTDFLATLSDRERVALAAELSQLGQLPLEDPRDAPALTHVVAEWNETALNAELATLSEPGDPQRGRQIFASARCKSCHRCAGEGRAFGPDLTAAAARYSRRDLLDALLRPSAVMDEKYRDVVVETDDGRLLVGQLAGGDADSIYIATDPLRPVSLERVERSGIVNRVPSQVSPMPQGLLNVLTAQDISDLLAYLQQAAQK